MVLDNRHFVWTSNEKHYQRGTGRCICSPKWCFHVREQQAGTGCTSVHEERKVKASNLMNAVWMLAFSLKP